MSIKKYGTLEIEEEAARIEKPSIKKFTARWILFLFLLISFIGLTGSGYFAHSKITSSDRNILIFYDRLGRHQVRQQLTILLMKNIVQSSPVRISFDKKYLERTYIRQILPSPSRSTVVNNKIVYEFNAPKNSSAMTIAYLIEPESRGLVNVTIGLNNLYTAHYQQFIFP